MRPSWTGSKSVWRLPGEAVKVARRQGGLQGPKQAWIPTIPSSGVKLNVILTDNALPKICRPFRDNSGISDNPSPAYIGLT